MELSPSWEAASCSATQELPSILWNPNVNYRVQNGAPLPSPRPFVTFRKKLIFDGEELSVPRSTPKLEENTCRLFATALQYCGIFATRKNDWATEIAVAKWHKHTTIKQRQPVSRQQLGKHVPTRNNGNGVPLDECYNSLLGSSQRANDSWIAITRLVFFVWSVRILYNEDLLYLRWKFKCTCNWTMRTQAQEI
jgi:hypothetical protein